MAEVGGEMTFWRDDFLLIPSGGLVGCLSIRCCGVALLFLKRLDGYNLEVDCR